MWSGPLHYRDFVASVLGHVEANEDKYGTSARMKGMLTVAKEVGEQLNGKAFISRRLADTPPTPQELDTPFYFTPSKVSSHFHCVCPSLDETA